MPIALRHRRFPQPPRALLPEHAGRTALLLISLFAFALAAMIALWAVVAIPALG